MADSKSKGDIGEAMVLVDALKRGYKVAQPIGEDWPYDLIILRKGKLERVQCKYTKSNGEVIIVKCRSTNNWVDRKYTEDDLDWIAVYDATTDKCYYIPSSELKEGRATINLRLKPAKNGQKAGIKMATDYLDWKE